MGWVVGIDSPTPQSRRDRGMGLFPRPPRPIGEVAAVTDQALARSGDLRAQTPDELELVEESRGIGGGTSRTGSTPSPTPQRIGVTTGAG